MRRVLLFGLSLNALLLATVAVAHPHVWVRSGAVVMYGPDGRVTGIRHRWTFDAPYSAFAVSGFETGPDGKLDPDKMAELAKINVESLAESGFFTHAKANGAKLSFGEPRNYGTAYEKGELILTFDLPLASPAKADRAFLLEVYDPTFFVDFTVAEGDDAIRLDGAPKGCAVNVTRPKPTPPSGDAPGVAESLFSALSAAGSGVRPRVLVACP